MKITMYELLGLVKDEIKEKIKAYYVGNDIDEVLDYITNLQEENKRLNLELTGYRKAILRDDKLLGLQEYKQRNEKAIEYIKLGKTFENKEIEIVVEKLQNDLLNILGGDDNE